MVPRSVAFTTVSAAGGPGLELHPDLSRTKRTRRQTPTKQLTTRLPLEREAFIDDWETVCTPPDDVIITTPKRNALRVTPSEWIQPATVWMPQIKAVYRLRPGNTGLSRPAPITAGPLRSRLSNATMPGSPPWAQRRGTLPLAPVSNTKSGQRLGNPAQPNQASGRQCPAQATISPCPGWG